MRRSGIALVFIGILNTVIMLIDGTFVASGIYMALFGAFLMYLGDPLMLSHRDENGEEVDHSSDSLDDGD